MINYGDNMKKLIGKMDLWLLLFIIIYIILGLIMIYTASSFLTVAQQGVSSNYYFIRQGIFTIIGLLVSFIFVIRIPTKNYHFFTTILIIGIIASLTGLFVYGFIGNGAKSWYDLGVINFQPSEFAKSVLIVYLAVNYNRLINKKEKNIYRYLFPLLTSVIIVALVFMQPDAGSALITSEIVALMFFSTPIAPMIKKKCYKTIFIGILISIIVILLAGKNIFNSRQLNRLTFTNPCTRYTENTGYQVCNGFIAIKNGGIFGVGLGNSTQKYLYLPEAHTDFIFPIIVEELGLIGGVLVILGYMFILLRILKIARKATSIRNALIAYGVFCFLLLQIVVNLVGVLALAPLTGVPLPLLSYGGSFNLNVIIMLFVVERIAIENNEALIRKKLKNL